MHLSVIIKLCFNLLFYNQVVSSSLNLFSRNETIFNKTFDDVLRKFFFDFNKIYLQKSKPWHIAVVGASNEDLQQIQLLFESYPYSICKEIEICGYMQRFRQRSFIIVFLQDFNEDKFRGKVNVLLPCSRCTILFISNATVQQNNVKFVLTWAMQHNLPFSKFANFGRNFAELYSDFLALNCTEQIQLVTVWKPGFHLDGMLEWAFQSRNMNGCPVTVSSLTFTPKMMIRKNENGSLAIVGGQEGKLMLLLAEKLNFTINLKHPSIFDQLKYSRKSAILNDVITGISEIGIGRLPPLLDDSSFNLTSFSVSYDEECITWGVPRLLKWSDNIMWIEFPWEVWILVGLVFAAGCIVKYTYRNTIAVEDSNRQGIGFAAVVLDVLALHLGNPVTYAISFLGGRFALISYLCYAIVITTAYKASLASIMATDSGVPIIVNAEEIIKADLKVGGSEYDWYILKNQFNESETTSQLLKRFVINNNDSALWNQLYSSHDWAIIGRRSLLDYERQMNLKGQDRLNFNVLDNCVLAYPTVIYFNSRSFDRLPVDNIIRRLVESGIPSHWDVAKIDMDKLLKRRTREMYFQYRGVYKIWNIFSVYSVCIFICILTFLIELFI